MTEVLLFHHAMGQTAGCHAFAAELRRAGHPVHTPDLFGGRTFASIEDGMAHVEQLGFGAFIEAGTRAAEDLPAELVYAGFSLGVLPAQKLAQTRPGALGAVLCYSGRPALLRRFQPAQPRPGGSRPAHRPGARLPRRSLSRLRLI